MNGLYCKNCITTFISTTAPAHNSILTGCYMDGYGLVIGKSEVERLMYAVNKRPKDFIPQYLSKIKRALQNGNHIKLNDDKYKLKGDKSRNFIEFSMTAYYPCPFLEVDDDLTACMIYPYRFQICKNTLCEDCYKSN